jgi:hypothetical protein
MVALHIPFGKAGFFIQKIKKKAPKQTTKRQ